MRILQAQLIDAFFQTNVSFLVHLEQFIWITLSQKSQFFIYQKYPKQSLNRKNSTKTFIYNLKSTRHLAIPEVTQLPNFPH